MCVTDIYNKLQECYTCGESTNSDKAKTFRSIFETFVNEQMPELSSSKLSLGPKLKELFKASTNQNVDKIEDATKVLLNRLNTIVHESCYVSSEDLNNYYQTLLLIIKLLTEVEPTTQQLLIAGLNKNSITNGLNNEQRVSVLDEAHVVNVNAGPGTGKTHLLVRKLLYTIYKHPEWKVVALSFTNSAASQLKSRVLSMIEDLCYTDIAPKNCITATIHSFCYNLMSQYAKSQNENFDYEILDDSVIEEVANEIAEEHNLSYQKDEIKKVLINGGSSPVSGIVEEYKRQHHFIRVEEILDLFINKIKNEPAFKTWMTEKVDCLLVDESQDLSRKVYVIIEALYAINPDMEMFFVGDPRQNIFSFNDGKYRNFTDFMNRLHIKPSEHNLQITYRCPVAVVNLVNGLSFTDCSNPKLIPAENTVDGECEIIAASYDTDEARRIVNIIREIDNHTETCVIATGLKYLELTANYLNRASIPFVLKGGQTTMNPTIKVINHCLRLVEKENANSKKSLMRMGIVNGLFSDLTNLREKQKKSPMLVSSLIMTIQEILYQNNLLINTEERIIAKYAAIAEKYDSISDFLFACTSKKNDEFADFYKRSFNVECTTKVTDDNPPVTLSTIHSAKGLEWENVILASAVDKILPHYGCYAEDDVSRAIEMKNDEKKKYYVAVTRSKKNIYITYTTKFLNKWGKTYSRSLSPFVIRPY